MTVVTDGASRGNPGPAAIGFIILDGQGNILLEHVEYIGRATNNEAEYQALISALDKCVEYCRGHVKHYTDSQLLVNHLSGMWAVRAENLKPLIEQVHAKKRSFESVVHKRLPRTSRLVRRVDRMLNQKLDELDFSRSIRDS